jgi:hypothetical protein
VEGWRDLVKATAQKIAVQEIATRKKTAAIEKADDAGADNKTETYQDQKDQIMENLTQLPHNKATLLSRLDVALNAYEAKGGNSEDLRKYAKTVAGITIPFPQRDIHIYQIDAKPIGDQQQPVR